MTRVGTSYLQWSASHSFPHIHNITTGWEHILGGLQLNVRFRVGIEEQMPVVRSLLDELRVDLGPLLPLLQGVELEAVDPLGDSRLRAVLAWSRSVVENPGCWDYADSQVECGLLKIRQHFGPILKQLCHSFIHSPSLPPAHGKLNRFMHIHLVVPRHCAHGARVRDRHVHDRGVRDHPWSGSRGWQQPSPHLLVV